MSNSKKSKTRVNLVKPQQAGKKIEDSISFDYELSADYKIYAINGIFGGVTPKGEVMMNLFYERQPIPKKSTYNIKKDGTIGDETDRIVGKSFVRSIPLGVSMTIDTAKALRQWLDDKIEQFDTVFIPNHEKEE